MNDPAAFSKYNLNTFNDAKLFLSKYKNHFKFEGKEDVLEFGCANGVITKELVYPFFEGHLNSLTGTDVSQDALDIAEKLHGADKIFYKLLNIEDENVWMGYKEKFGHIFGFSVLHLLKTQDRGLKNIFNMLTPNGQFFTTILLPPHPYLTTETMQIADKTAPWAKYVENAPPMYYGFGDQPKEAVRKLFESEGFKIKFMEINSVLATFKTFEELQGYVYSLCAFYKYIPKELQEEYKKDTLDKVMMNLKRSDDGGYWFDKSVLAILAVKS